MNILVHDYAGHPFQAELSRELARRGHTVHHGFFAADSGPKGRMSRVDGDPEALTFLPIGSDIPYSKTNLFRRRAGDLAYGKKLADWIQRRPPDVVISGNTPTETQEIIQAACRRLDVPFVFWCQDFYSIAVSTLLEKKLPVVGHLVGARYRALERRQMRRADHIVVIADAFRDHALGWDIPPDKLSVIPNWGAIEAIGIVDRDTAWAAANGLSDAPRFVYSGTMALKHNPELIAALAAAVEGQAEVVLVSAGVGADSLKARNETLKSLTCLPLQPFESFAEVLGSADVLLGVIERDAGEYSVPSKILSYLCAGRPIVLAAPRENLAAQILIETGAGTVVEPEDVGGFVAAATDYIANPAKAEKAAAAGRAYAERHFPLPNVADRFEVIFDVVSPLGRTGA